MYKLDSIKKSICFLLIVILISGCQPINKNPDTNKPDNIKALDISSILSNEKDNVIVSCLWADENTLILASKNKETNINQENGETIGGETEFYLYDITQEKATLLSMELPRWSYWDWNLARPVKNEEVIGFSQRGTITFSQDDLTDMNIELGSEDIESTYSPDLSYAAEVKSFETDNEEDFGVALSLHNLLTGETTELDRSVIAYGGVATAKCEWSFDSSILAYIIDYNRLLIYDSTTGKSKRINLDEIKGKENISLCEFFSISFTPSGKLLITAISDSSEGGYAHAVLKDNYDDMEWIIDNNVSSLYIIGESGGKVYAEGSKSEREYTGVVYYSESLETEVVFKKDGEYFSTGALSPHGKSIAVITHESYSYKKQHLYILPVE